MEITLEKIELVKDRTGVGYKEAKEALEQTDGNVVDAIILIEENIDTASEEKDSKVSQIVDSIKETIRKGNVSRLVIKKEEETLLNLPVSVGLIGTVIFPWAAVVGVIAAFGTKCKIELVKDDGEIVNVSDKATDKFDTVVSKGSVIVDEVKDKSNEWFQTAKDKGGEVVHIAMDKGEEYFNKAKNAGLEAYDVVKGKAESVLKKDAESTENFEDIDLSDIDLSGAAEAAEDVAETVADVVAEDFKEEQ